MQRPEHGRALFYTRDSGGKHEMTPGQYVNWAIGRSKQQQLSFDGTTDGIATMIRDGLVRHGDLFLDYDVCGNLLSRPGLDALIAEVDRDKNVSHVLIPRRDRLARPDDPLDGVQLELDLRRRGVYIEYMDRLCPPIAKGQRLKLDDLLSGVIDFDRAGKDRTELAQKILLAQLSLAERGFSTGGRPPYGFRRWLVQDDGTHIRELTDGERVRTRGQHVVLLPGPDSEWDVINRILGLLKTTPANRVAKILTEEGIPSPDAGRYRTDHNVKHMVRGVWHQTTVINIARNPLLVAMSVFGRRSMGDQLRYSSSGPRALEDCDYRADGKPKVIRRPDGEVIRTTARFAPRVDPAEHDSLLHVLDQRGASQRGKPRSRDPSKNPLGSRIFDMNCGWPMYRVPAGETFKYKCGAYMQARQCDHNQIDGPTIARFGLSCLRQKLSPRLIEKIEARLRAYADADQARFVPDINLSEKKTVLASLKADLSRIQRNMALAENESQYRATAAVYEETKQSVNILEHEVLEIARQQSSGYNAEAEIIAAMAVLERLPEVAANCDNLAKIGEVFRQVNLRMFLRFQKVQIKKRTVNKLAVGAVTFGDAPAPVPLYSGPTGRRASTAITAAAFAAGSENGHAVPNCMVSGEEGNSLGNVSRGDRI
jgi:hypothetical protein